MLEFEIIRQCLRVSTFEEFPRLSSSIMAGKRIGWLASPAGNKSRRWLPHPDLDQADDRTASPAAFSFFSRSASSSSLPYVHQRRQLSFLCDPLDSAGTDLRLI